MINETVFVTNTYEKIAKEFSDTRYHVWNFVKFFMKDKQNLYGIDIGCGNGKNMIHSNMIGIDNCKGFINICKTRNKDVVLGDICALPFKSETFDYTISIATLHHLSSEERRIKCIDEMIRVMKKNGEGVISVWSHEFQTKHKFELGDNLVPWKSRNVEIKPELRYYYIMNFDMFTNLIGKFKNKIKIISIENEKGNWILHYKKYK